MSSCTSAFIGYGFIIDIFEDAPIDYDKPEWDNWVMKLEISDYYHYVNAYDNSIHFFGVCCSSVVGEGEFETIPSCLSYDKNDWENCLKEFKKFFPNYQAEPQFKLINVYYG